MISSPDAHPAIINRYISLQVEGLRAELLMIESLKLASWKKWTEMLETVELAFDLMIRVLVEADGWWALMAHTDENGGTLLEDNFHCRDLLDQQLRSLDFIRDTAREKCDEARRRCEKRLRELERILEPQWKERDEVKSKWGEEKWAQNPKPKRDYAARRLEAEEERRRVAEALECLTGLTTSRVYYSAWQRALSD